MPLFNFGRPSVEALQQKGDVEGLIKLLQKEKDSAVRLAAIKALGELKNGLAFSTLDGLTCNYSASKAEQSAAMDALVAMGSNYAVDSLIRWMTESQAERQTWAKQMLVYYGEKSVAKLARFMNEENGKFSLDAADVLRQIGSPSALQSVEQAGLHLEAMRQRWEEAQKRSVVSPERYKQMVQQALQSRMDEINAAATCKAYQNGHCVVRGEDSGACTWNPADWANCGVVIENKKVYGSW